MSAGKASRTILALRLQVLLHSAIYEYIAQPIIELAAKGPHPHLAAALVGPVPVTRPYLPPRIDQDKPARSTAPNRHRLSQMKAAQTLMERSEPKWLACGEAV